MAETIVVFGNCQAETIAAGFHSVPVLQGSEIIYVRSFKMSDAEINALIPPEVRDRCTLLFEQVMPLVSLTDRYTFLNARRVTFSSLDFNLLWPQRAEEKRNRPEPPDFPFGRYGYGDRIINEVVALGLTGDEGWDYFVAKSDERMPDLTRMCQIEEQRWQAIEAPLDVKMSDIIFQNLVTMRMFWTYNHPNRETLCRFATRILEAAGLAPEGYDTMLELMLRIIHWEFGANYHQPVHPLVAERLGLQWWTPDLLYRRIDIEMPYETFIRRQIAYE